MILNIIILWVLILILSGTIWCLYKWYKQEQQEQDERIQQLEKRLEDYKKLSKQFTAALTETISDYHIELEDEIKLIKKQLKKKSDKE